MSDRWFSTYGSVDIQDDHPGLSPDFHQLRGLKKAPGIVQRRPRREMNDIVCVVVIAQQLVADFPGVFPDVCGLIKNSFPCWIRLDLMND